MDIGLANVNGGVSPTFAAPINKEECDVKAVVQNFWASSRKLDWKRMGAQLEFPFTSMPVGPHYAGYTHVYRNQHQFQEQFQDIKKLTLRGLKLEVEERNAGLHISKIQVKIVNHTSAHVTYTFQPAGDKAPYSLITVLRKGDKGWKMVFSTVPW